MVVYTLTLKESILKMTFFLVLLFVVCLVLLVGIIALALEIRNIKSEHSNQEKRNNDLIKNYTHDIIPSLEQQIKELKDEKNELMYTKNELEMRLKNYTDIAFQRFSNTSNNSGGGNRNGGSKAGGGGKARQRRPSKAP